MYEYILVTQKPDERFHIMAQTLTSKKTLIYQNLKQVWVHYHLNAVDGWTCFNNMVTYVTIGICTNELKWFSYQFDVFAYLYCCIEYIWDPLWHIHSVLIIHWPKKPSNAQTHKNTHTQSMVKDSRKVTQSRRHYYCWTDTKSWTCPKTSILIFFSLYCWLNVPNSHIESNSATNANVARCALLIFYVQHVQNIHIYMFMYNV